MQCSRTAVVLTVAFILTMSVSTAAQPPRGAFGNLTTLLEMEAIQKELALTDAQKEKVIKLLEEAHAASRAAFRPGDLQNPNAEERKKRFADAGERIKKTEEAIKSILSEKQYSRLVELSIQHAGVTILPRRDIAEKLKLTDDQKMKLHEIIQTFAGFGGPNREFNPTPTPEERRKEMEEARARREKFNTDAIGVLTTEQKKVFEDMQGKKFEFPPAGGNRPAGGVRPAGGRPQQGQT